MHRQRGLSPFADLRNGTAPVGADGKTVGVGDVAAQTRPCIEVIKAALEQAGSGMHHVVRTESDATWPGPVWGAVEAASYSDQLLQQRLTDLRHSLAAHLI